MLQDLPKIVLTDIDGVWTNGGMFYSEKGDELKMFNTSDSFGVLLCKLYNIPVVIISGENTEIVRRRAKKLGITELHLGVKNKLLVAEKIISSHNVTYQQTAYIGDDIIDLPLLKKVKYSGAPANAPEYVRKHVNVVLTKRGGEGAFREFIEKIFTKAGLLHEALLRAEEYYIG